MATRFSLYRSVERICFHSVLQNSASGLMNITWYIPFRICCLSLDFVSLTYTAEMPNDCIDPTCSSMRAINGDITNIIDFFSTPRTLLEAGCSTEIYQTLWGGKQKHHSLLQIEVCFLLAATLVCILEKRLLHG